MEMFRFLCYVVLINCVSLFACYAKPFSLNEIVEAEKKAALATRKKIPESTVPNQSSIQNDVVPSRHFKKRKTKKAGASTKKLTPLQYRKLFQINAPLKPKLKFSKSRLRRKNLARKRQNIKDAQFGNKYIPLLRNIGVLFNTLLDSDESNGSENFSSENFYTTETRKRNVICNCAIKPQADSPQTATTITPSTNKITNLREASPEADSSTHNFTPSNLGSIRLNKNLSVLPTRNSFSVQRNHLTIGKRSGATLHTDPERNITQHNGNSQHNTGSETNKTYAGHHESNPSRIARDGADRDRSNRRFRGRRNNTKSPGNSGADEAKIQPKTKITSGEVRDYIYEFEDKDQFNIRRHETDSTDSPRKQSFGISNPEVKIITESVQSNKDSKEGILHVTKHNSSNQRFTEGSSLFPTENQTFHAADETITLHPMAVKNLGKMNNTKVIIIEGYSVTRSQFGINKLAGKAIHVHK